MIPFMKILMPWLPGLIIALAIITTFVLAIAVYSMIVQRKRYSDLKGELIKLSFEIRSIGNKENRNPRSPVRGPTPHEPTTKVAARKKNKPIDWEY